ncbi:tRNA (guanine(46)-N(7))-methyltransferase TrmB [Celerinatantimonas sp. YJH-8]|uniref:tRNA (guanine(46)-N(7))-methyltransferase TrmB n=1 Tax=Celerinatantimonas sp. YJH-8 TaxID=3228714 RepID=UPI0038C2B907
MISPQPDIHPKLIARVERYRQHANRRPVADHSLQAFEQMLRWLDEHPSGPLILDSCCGVGESTAQIAALYPEARVVGIDKSGVRLDKHHAYRNQQANYLLLRADLNDVWRLMDQHGLKLWRHFLLYPTPWPKPAQLLRRWYASNAFPALVALGGVLQVRSNWELYLRECAQALNCYGVNCQPFSFVAEQPLTPFERKYAASGQQLWQLQADLDQAACASKLK